MLLQNYINVYIFNNMFIHLEKMVRIKENNGMTEYGDGDSSDYNEAFLKMHRLDRLQNTINDCSNNPLSYNEEINTFNYELRFSTCNSLLQEIYSKLSEEERKDILALKNAIEIILIKYPIHSYKSNVITKKKELKINNNNWLVIKNWLYKYELKLRDLLDKTGYTTKSKDYYDGL